jgi:acyl-CoA thioester hydrolase
VTDELPRLPREAFPVFRTVPTRWADNDIYGHVNNVVYYALFDTAVNAELIDRNLLDPHGDGPIFVVAETRCRYFASLAFPVSIDIGIGVERLGRTSITYLLCAYAAGASEAKATCRFVHVCVDREHQRPQAIPDVWRAVLERTLALRTGREGSSADM